MVLYARSRVVASLQPWGHHSILSTLKGLGPLITLSGFMVLYARSQGCRFAPTLGSN